MSDVLSELQKQVLYITLNRIDKHNAFDETLLTTLQSTLDTAQHDSQVRVIVLKANGRHFSAGADLAWMQRMAQFTEQENLADAQVLARLMFSLHHSVKPTIAMVQGAAMGGGAGLVAACDIAIAANNARFCFSEVKVGLIPATISPYVIKAIGERTAAWLFMTAEIVDAQRALAINLIQHCIAEEELLSFTTQYAQQLAQLAPLAVREAKALVRQVANQTIDEALLQTTASLIAKKRASAEGQEGLHAFLNKKSPNWN